MSPDTFPLQRDLLRRILDDEFQGSLRL